MVPWGSREISVSSASRSGIAAIIFIMILLSATRKAFSANCGKAAFPKETNVNCGTSFLLFFKATEIIGGINKSFCSCLAEDNAYSHTFSFSSKISDFNESVNATILKVPIIEAIIFLISGWGAWHNSFIFCKAISFSLIVKKGTNFQLMVRSFLLSTSL
jgi:hypothetical protein